VARPVEHIVTLRVWVRRKQGDETG
jgi:hypothetical protein